MLIIRGKNIIEISLNSIFRTIYQNIKDDILIIEMKKNDGIINIDSFLEIDSQIYEDNKNKIFLKRSIYFVDFQNEKKMEYLFGEIKNIDNNNNNFEYTCINKKSSTGSPIMDLLNSKVIGIHKITKNNMQNIGIFLKEHLLNFNLLFNNNNCKINIIKSNNFIKSKKNNEKYQNNIKNEFNNQNINKIIKVNEFVMK